MPDVIREKATILKSCEQYIKMPYHHSILFRKIKPSRHKNKLFSPSQNRFSEEEKMAFLLQENRL
jgi:hypothetical protein